MVQFKCLFQTLLQKALLMQNSIRTKRVATSFTTFPSPLRDTIFCSRCPLTWLSLVFFSIPFPFSNVVNFFPRFLTNKVIAFKITAYSDSLRSKFFLHPLSSHNHTKRLSLLALISKTLSALSPALTESKFISLNWTSPLDSTSLLCFRTETAASCYRPTKQVWTNGLEPDDHVLYVTECLTSSRTTLIAP